MNIDFRKQKKDEYMLSCLYSHVKWQLIGWYAAGYLDNSDGALNNRGVNGNYWSSTQNSTTNGYKLNFNSTNSNVNNNNKANGFSVRCLSDYETILPKFSPPWS
ncbi:MAG: hypothetical protein ISS33_02850 [Candidatus Omnitrophica bacterium]|nr:hypothetical protein [Candidatus Omnitrophota bacterium]